MTADQVEEEFLGWFAEHERTFNCGDGCRECLKQYRAAFMAGLKHGEIRILHSFHNGTWDSQCPLCDAEREAEGQTRNRQGVWGWWPKVLDSASLTTANARPLIPHRYGRGR